jgi:hypothetical protein
MLAGVLSGQGTPKLVHERDVPVPLPMFHALSFKWSGHYLLDIEDNNTASPLLKIVRGEHEVERISFDIEGVSVLTVTDYAARLDGAIVLCGIARGSGPRLATVIVWVDSDRKRRLVTRVWPYVPEKLVFAADGTLWTAGSIHEEPGDSMAERNVIERFDSSGKLLNLLRPHPKVDPAEGSEPYHSYLMASRDRVGWFTSGNQYIEYSLAAQELARYSGPPGADPMRDLCGVGLDQANGLAVCVRQKDTTSVLMLNRAHGSWQPVLPDEKRSSLLLGYDGQTLVMSSLPSTDESWVLRRYEARVGEGISGK